MANDVEQLLVLTPFKPSKTGNNTEKKATNPTKCMRGTTFFFIFFFLNSRQFPSVYLPAGYPPAAAACLFTHVHMRDSGDFSHLCMFVCFLRLCMIHTWYGPPTPPQ